MNFDDFQRVWRSPHNHPSPEQIEKDQRTFVSELKRRRRVTLAFLCFIFAVLTLITVKVIAQIAWPDPSMDAIDPAREWGAPVFLFLPWIAALAFARLQFTHRRAHAHFERSIGDTLRALLDENRNARRRSLIVAGLNLAMLALIPVVVQQLRDVGKAGDEIFLPGFVIFPAIMLLVFAGMVWQYRRKLLPEKHELEALLRSYQAPDP